MKTKSSTQQVHRSTESLRKSTIKKFVKNDTRLKDEDALSTIDGFIIPESAKLAAVKNGAGVMIGGYFVGVTTHAELSFSFPDIVY